MRFTIRDLLWLTVVVAVSFGWYAHNRSWERAWRDEGEQGYQLWLKMYDDNLTLQQRENLAEDQVKKAEQKLGK